MTRGSPSSALPFALAYARRGWRVHPVHWPTRAGSGGARCSCAFGARCPSVGKHPMLLGWPDLATTSEDVIRAWWREHPSANVGIATGPASGLLVLDVDPRNGGDLALEALLASHGGLEPTMRVETGGGGVHFYLAHPSGGAPLRGALAKGLDVKAGGGTVVAPPSLHASGRRYAWAAGASPRDLAPAVLPSWLLALVTVHPHVEPRPAEARAARRPRRVLGDEEALDVLVRECSFVSHCARDAASLSYDEWFSLATILHVFREGPALFEQISRYDAARYRRGEPARKLASVRGGPRHCTSLGWSCPRLGACSALGVRSPAGLPFKLRKAGA